MDEVAYPTRHCVLLGLMGAGKTTVGMAMADLLHWPFRDSDGDIQAATGLTVRELRDRDGTDAMHALEAMALLDALAAPGPTIIGAAASVVDDAACRDALAAPDVVTVWLRAQPALLAGRFTSADGHRPTFGESPEALLEAQLTERGPALSAVSKVVVDVDALAPAEITARVVEALG